MNRQPTSTPADRAHRIRLPEPWYVTRLPAAGTPDGTPASISFRRSFQRPSGITQQSRITLEIQLVEALPFTVKLNGQLFAPRSTAENMFDVPIDPSQLAQTNQLEIDINLQSTDNTTPVPSESQDVRLGAHYLKAVALRIE